MSHWVAAPVDSAFKKQRQFIAYASHELKTPLTVILTNTELMHEAFLCSHSSDFSYAMPKLISSTKTMSLRMKELISHMLELAKTEPDTNAAKNAASSFTDIDLTSMAEDAALTFDAMFFENEQTLHTEIDENIHNILMPDMASSDITDPLIEEHYFPIIPIAQGLTIGTANNGATVTSLLDTSDLAFSKSDGYNITTYEKEDADTDGPFSVAVSITTANDGQIVWISSSYFLDDMYNSYSSGANIDIAMNALNSMIGDTEAIAIRSKSLNYSYLTISDSTSSLLKLLMIGVFPLVFLVIGIAVVIIRRGLQNETA